MTIDGVGPSGPADEADRAAAAGDAAAAWASQAARQAVVAHGAAAARNTDPAACAHGTKSAEVAANAEAGGARGAPGAGGTGSRANARAARLAAAARVIMTVKAVGRARAAGNAGAALPAETAEPDGETGDAGSSGPAESAKSAGNGIGNGKRKKKAACRRAWWRRGCADFAEEIEHLKAPDGGALVPWLLMALGPAADVAQGRVAEPWLGGAGLLVFAVLYVAVCRTAYSERRKGTRLPLRLLAALAATTVALAVGYGGNFLLLFVLVSLGVGSVAASRRQLGLMLLPLSATAGTVSGLHHEGFWSTASLAYGTFLSGLVVCVIITLFDAVSQLRATRQELARSAVAQERLRFSRDLHDLLGHTLSVVVVKSEAARRLAPRDLDAALGQVADIEAVGRQALTEIREAVTGYREGSLSTELDRARSALTASDIELVLQESGPPLPPRTEALLGWVIREGVTNMVRHSGATRARIELRTDAGHARLTITDNGSGPAPEPGPPAGRPGSAATAVRRRTGTGLRGLTERLAAAGGSLTHGRAPGGGFRVTAVLPVEEDDTRP